jgi:hypothetical protein
LLNQIQGFDESYDFFIRTDKINRQEIRLGQGHGRKN